MSIVSKARGWLSWDLDRNLADCKALNHFHKLLQYVSFISEQCAEILLLPSFSKKETGNLNSSWTVNLRQLYFMEWWRGPGLESCLGYKLTRDKFLNL